MQDFKPSRDSCSRALAKRNGDFSTNMWIVGDITCLGSASMGNPLCASLAAMSSALLVPWALTISLGDRIRQVCDVCWLTREFSSEPERRASLISGFQTAAAGLSCGKLDYKHSKLP